MAPDEGQREMGIHVDPRGPIAAMADRKAISVSTVASRPSRRQRQGRVSTPEIAASHSNSNGASGLFRVIAVVVRKTAYRGANRPDAPRSTVA